MAVVLMMCSLVSCTSRTDSPTSSSALNEDQKIVATEPTPSRASTWRPVFRDIDGHIREPFRNADVRAIALIFVMQDCPIANSYMPALNRLCEEFGQRGIEILLLHVDPDLTEEAARRHAQQYEVQGPVLLDTKHAWVKTARITRTPEAAVFSPTGELLYRGRIDDQYADLGKRRAQVTSHDLRNVLEAIIAGRPISQPRTDAVGCFIPEVRSGG